MNNFMAKSRRQGFYGEDHNNNHNHGQNQIMMNNSGSGTLPFSSTSSTSSSSSSSPSAQLHKSLVPLNFRHQMNQLGTTWLEPRQTSAQEDIRCYTGEFAKPDPIPMDASPAAPNNDDDASAAAAAAADGYNDVNREDSSPDGLGLGLGGGGGATGSSTSAGVVAVVEKEHMFDKVVTPSDVGKLNRLVIPKQHAEKYFPLDSSTNEKGLLLNFEDRNGKPWRFRYSYWNSSQSYVMTKGWSRFVKEKKLDAGDIVSFQRGVGETAKDRHFIDWRRRPDAPDLPPSSYPTFSHLPHHYYSFHSSAHSHPWTRSPHFLQQQQQQTAPPAASLNHTHLQHPNATGTYQPHSGSHGYNYNYSYGGSGTGPYYGHNINTMANPSSSSVIYLRSGGGAGPQQAAAGMVQVESGGRRSGGDGGVETISMPMPMVFESVPLVHGKAAAKRLRLFGVNMDCPITESDEECGILSSTTIPHATMAPHPQLSSSPIPPLQLRLSDGSPLPPIQSDLLDKGKASRKSFDLDI